MRIVFYSPQFIAEVMRLIFYNLTYTVISRNSGKCIAHDRSAKIIAIGVRQTPLREVTTFSISPSH